MTESMYVNPNLIETSDVVEWAERSALQGATRGECGGSRMPQAGDQSTHKAPHLAPAQRTMGASVSTVLILFLV
jgi:hypothetical protein